MQATHAQQGTQPARHCRKITAPNGLCYCTLDDCDLSGPCHRAAAYKKHFHRRPGLLLRILEWIELKCDRFARPCGVATDLLPDGTEAVRCSRHRSRCDTCARGKALRDYLLVDARIQRRQRGRASTSCLGIILAAAAGTGIFARPDVAFDKPLDSGSQIGVSTDLARQASIASLAMQIDLGAAHVVAARAFVDEFGPALWAVTAEPSHVVSRIAPFPSDTFEAVAGVVAPVVGVQPASRALESARQANDEKKQAGCSKGVDRPSGNGNALAKVGCDRRDLVREPSPQAWNEGSSGSDYQARQHSCAKPHVSPSKRPNGFLVV